MGARSRELLPSNLRTLHWKPRGGYGYFHISPVVHSLYPVLAVGSAGVNPISLRVAFTAAVSAGGNRGPWRAGFGLGDRHISGAAIERTVRKTRHWSLASRVGCRYLMARGLLRSSRNQRKR